MTVLTSEGNCIGQPDKCYVIVDVGFVVLTVNDAVSWCDCQWTTFWSIISISTQYDLVKASTAKIIYY